MACCNAVFERCAPDGSTVIGVLDADAGSTSYFNVDGTAYAGDASLLGSCASGAVSSLTTVANADGSVTVTHNAGDGSAPTSFTTAVDSDTFVTFTDNGDGTATFTSADGNSTVTVCTDCDPSTFTFTTNADGTITVSHDDGQGTVTTGTIPAGSATVTDNGDGTANVDDGTTDCDFPTQILLDCDGGNRAKGDQLRIVTVPEQAAIGGAFTPFVDSGDGCTPAPVTECPDLPRFTINLSKERFYWPAGGPWQEVFDVDDGGLEAEVFGNAGTWSAPDPSAPLGVNQVWPGSENCKEITNDDLCRVRTYSIEMNWGAWRSPAPWGAGMVLAFIPQYSVDGGGTWVENNSGYTVVTLTNGFHTGTFGSFTLQTALPPGDSRTVCMRLVGRFAFWDGAAAAGDVIHVGSQSMQCKFDAL